MSKWGGAVQPRHEQFQAKRRAVILEAGNAFSRNGFQNTSLDDIAKLLNVSKPALYYYVKSKHELLLECHMLAMDLGDEALGYGRSTGRTAVERLQLFIGRYIELLTGELGRSAVLTDQSALLPPDRERIQKRRIEFDRSLRAMVKEGVEDGSIAPCDPKMAVFWIMGAVNSISRWFDPDGPKSSAEIASDFVSFISTGLCSAKHSSSRRKTP